MIRKVSVPGKSLTGPVSLPASKSAAHRAILCASLAKGISHLSNFSFSQDMEATCRAVEALGVKTSLTGDTLTVDSRSLFAPSQAVFRLRRIRLYPAVSHSYSGRRRGPR